MTRSLRSVVVAAVATTTLAAPALAATPPFGAIHVLSPSTHSTFQPVVAMDDAGNATAFWNYASTSRQGMKVADRVVGEGFAPAYSLPSVGSNQLAFPNIDMAPDGTTAVVWAEDLAIGMALRASYRPPGGDWGATQTIMSDTDPNASFSSADIAVSDNGRVAVTFWHYLEDGSHNIEAALSDTSGTFGEAQVLDNRMGTESVGNFGPTVGIDSSGNAIAMWERFDDAETDPKTFIMYALAGGTQTSFEAPVSLTEVHQDGTDPRVAVNPSGAAVAIWIHNPATGDSFMNSATGTTTTGLANLATVPGGRPDWIDLALDEDGNSVAARRGLTSIQEEIQASVRPAGGSWGPSQTLDTNADTETSLETSDDTLDVASANGMAIVAWARETPLDYMPAHIAVLDPTTDTFEAKVTVSNSVADVDRLRIDMNGTGDVVLVWRDDGRVYSLGTWDPPATGNLTVQVQPRKQVSVMGSLTPPSPGEKVAVTLLRKRAGQFRRIAAKNATMDAAGDYAVSFQAPRPGTCRVKAVWAGDGLVRADTATRTFDC